MRFIPDKTKLNYHIVIPKHTIGTYSVMRIYLKRIKRLMPQSIIYAFVDTSLPLTSFLLLNDFNKEQLEIIKQLFAYVYQTKAELTDLFSSYWVYTPLKKLSNCLYPDDILPTENKKLPLFDKSL